MKKKITLEVKKERTRVPVPQKPPKAEESKKAYNRRKMREETSRLISGKGDRGGKK
ncbi:MAG: hypothetical protein ACM3Q2_12965 [Syntrophothermus sp.]